MQFSLLMSPAECCIIRDRWTERHTSEWLTRGGDGDTDCKIPFCWPCGFWETEENRSRRESQGGYLYQLWTGEVYYRGGEGGERVEMKEWDASELGRNGWKGCAEWRSASPQTVDWWDVLGSGEGERQRGWRMERDKEGEGGREGMTGEWGRCKGVCRVKEDFHMYLINSELLRCTKGWGWWREIERVGRDGIDLLYTVVITLPRRMSHSWL